jgi:hypothetical protein
MRINAIFLLMADMIRKISEIVKKRRPEWAETLTLHPINYCNFKGYFSVWNATTKEWEAKSVEFHRDVTHTVTGKPMKNNTQIPGTPVVILTFGDDKTLRFQKFGGNKKLNIPELVFQQKHGSLCLLDPRDEQTDEMGEYWKHMLEMNKDKSITFSFTFRLVATTVEVTEDGGKIHARKKGCQAQKGRAVDAG